MSIRSLFVVIVVVCLASLTACGSTSSAHHSSTGTGHLADCATARTTCNTARVRDGGTLTYVIEKPVTSWNVHKATSSTLEVSEVLSGVFPSVFITGPDLRPLLNTDVVASATQVSSNPQQLVYRIQTGAVWSDGQPIDATDFVYAWQTNSPRECPDCQAASQGGYDRIESVQGSNSGKTVTVTMKAPFGDWRAMFASLYPAHLAAQHADIATPAGRAKTFNDFFDKTQPTVSGGPYLVQSVDPRTSITESPNPRWYGRSKINLDRLVFRTITDTSAELQALANGEVQVIWPQPTPDLVTQARGLHDVSSYLGRALGVEHIDLNTANPMLHDRALRAAILSAIDRAQIVSRTAGQISSDIALVNNNVFTPTQPGYEDNLSDSGYGSGNVSKAKALLNSAGYHGVGTTLTSPAGQVRLRCSYTAGTTLRQQTCEIIQAELRGLGIDVVPTPISQLGPVLAAGDFDLIVYSSLGSPYVLTSARAHFETHGGSNGTRVDDPAATALIEQALEETDTAAAAALLNRADRALVADAISLPLYLKPTLLAVSNRVANVRDNSTILGPAYNVAEWGYRA